MGPSKPHQRRVLVLWLPDFPLAAEERRGLRALARLLLPVSPSYSAPPSALVAALDPLPLTRFGAPPGLLARLAELGVHRAGDLAALPRAAVAGRFGRAGLGPSARPPSWR